MAEYGSLCRKILENAQINAAETYHIEQPDGVYAEYGVSFEADGSDESLRLVRCSAVVELLEPAEHPDRAERDRLIHTLNQYYKDGVIGAWRCDERIFLQDVRLFMTTFYFTYIRRI